MDEGRIERFAAAARPTASFSPPLSSRNVRPCVLSSRITVSDPSLAGPTRQSEAKRRFDDVLAVDGIREPGQTRTAPMPLRRGPSVSRPHPSGANTNDYGASRLLCRSRQLPRWPGAKAGAEDLLSESSDGCTGDGAEVKRIHAR